jgi:probable blue pigment (indigoidine) exporter
MSRDIHRSSLTRTTAVSALTPIVWGTTYLVATEFLPSGRPILAATIRALPVGVLLVVQGRRLPTGSWWWRAVVLGVLNIGAFFALLFVAAFRLPGGVAATVGAIQPLIAACLAYRLLGERVTLRTAGAGAVGAFGVALLVLRAGAHLDGVGLVAALLATLSMATGVVLTKRWGRPVELLTFTGWQLTAGGIVLVPVLLCFEGLPVTLSTRNIAGFVWLSLIGTGLAYANWFRGIQLLPVATVSRLGLLSPVVATLSGWLVLGEHLTAIQLLGTSLVLFAVTGPTLFPNVRRPATTAKEQIQSGRVADDRVDSRIKTTMAASCP